MKYSYDDIVKLKEYDCPVLIYDIERDGRYRGIKLFKHIYWHGRIEFYDDDVSHKLIISSCYKEQDDGYVISFDKTFRKPKKVTMQEIKEKFGYDIEIID